MKAPAYAEAMAGKAGRTVSSEALAKEEGALYPTKLSLTTVTR
jgi:hypothetical protein